MRSSSKIISAGARASPLSKIQVKEVQEELQSHHPEIQFDPIYMKSTGDKNLQFSLRNLGKTDFFTKEIDAAVLNSTCHIGIHSAKDLAEPLPKGLKLIALTAGIDSSDSLVLKMPLELLPFGAKIATSSQRREELVRQLRPDLTFIDLRGTVEERLRKIETGEADGVVVAEAALIRLGLTHLYRICLPGETVPFQGQLAIIAREDDAEMGELFECIDVRRKKTVLYVGLEPPKSLIEKNKVIHCPVIKIVPKIPSSPPIPDAFFQISTYTHLIFTSKTGVRIFFEFLLHFGIDKKNIANKFIIAVGKATASLINTYGFSVDLIPEEETSEGILEKVNPEYLKSAYLFWPHSTLSRTLLPDFFKKNNIHFRECAVYDTVFNEDACIPNLERINEVIFTSPSTVEAFFKTVNAIPKDLVLTPIGAVTQAFLKKQKEKLNGSTIQTSRSSL